MRVWNQDMRENLTSKKEFNLSHLFFYFILGIIFRFYKK